TLAGRVEDIRTVIVFEADKVSNLQHAFEEAIEDYLDDCKEGGVEPDKPRSGTILVRTTPEMHRQVADAAQRTGMSINAWIEGALREAVTP
ncbi:MAG: type II toxin-antitoxin system HicB family antitoxin, partial [Chloroflexota bacterium]